MHSGFSKVKEFIEENKQKALQYKSKTNYQQGKSTKEPFHAYWCSWYVVVHLWLWRSKHFKEMAKEKFENDVKNERKFVKDFGCSLL